MRIVGVFVLCTAVILNVMKWSEESHSQFISFPIFEKTICMKYLPLLLFCSVIFVSCKENVTIKKTTHEDCKHDYDTTRIVRSNDERLSKYFALHEISPKIIINNIDSSQTNITLGDHSLKWEVIKNQKNLIIDKNIIQLKNEITINEVHNLQKDTLNAAKNWTQIKLYQYSGREIIALEMKYLHCDDPSCISNFYLFYDTKNKSTNYFGTFRSNLEMNLYNFGDGKISFVSQSHLNYPACNARIFNPYTIDDEGIFRLQTKKDGKPYQIEQNYTDEGIKEFERLEQSAWIKKIE